MENDFAYDEPTNNTPASAVYPIGTEGIDVLERLYKWSNFFFIISIVNLAIGAILNIVLVSISNSLGPAQYQQTPIGSVMSLLIASPLYVIPLIFIHRFRTNLQKALDGNNPYILSTAFEFAKKYFKFQFILLSICIGVILLIFLLTMLTFVMMGGAA